MGSQRVGHDWATEPPHAGSRLRGIESSCSAGARVDVGSPLGREDPQEEEMATYLSILAWEIP